MQHKLNLPFKFCLTCQNNQILVDRIMSEYLPEESNPDHKKLFENAEKYKRNLEKKYPISCHDCQLKVEEILSKKQGAIKIKQFKDALYRSTPLKFSREPIYHHSRLTTLALIVDKVSIFLFDTKISNILYFRFSSNGHPTQSDHIAIRPTFRKPKYFFLWLLRFLLVFMVNLYTWNKYSKRFWGLEFGFTNNLLLLTSPINIKYHLPSNFQYHDSLKIISGYFRKLFITLGNVDLSHLLIPLGTLQFNKFIIFWPVLALNPTRNVQGTSNYKRFINILFFWRLLFFNFDGIVNKALNSRFQSYFAIFTLALDLSLLIFANTSLSISPGIPKRTSPSTSTAINSEDDNCDFEAPAYKNENPQSVFKPTFILDNLALSDTPTKKPQSPRIGSFSSTPSSTFFSLNSQSLKKNKSAHATNDSAIRSQYLESRSELNSILGTSKKSDKEALFTASALGELNLIGESSKYGKLSAMEIDTLEDEYLSSKTASIFSETGAEKSYKDVRVKNQHDSKSPTKSGFGFAHRSFFPQENPTGLEDIFISKLSIDEQDARTNAKTSKPLAFSGFLDSCTNSGLEFIKKLNKLYVLTASTALTSVGEIGGDSVLVLNFALVIFLSTCFISSNTNPESRNIQPASQSPRIAPQMFSKLKRVFGWVLLFAAILSFILPTVILLSFYGKFGYSNAIIFSASSYGTSDKFNTFQSFYKADSVTPNADDGFDSSSPESLENLILVPRNSVKGGANSIFDQPEQNKADYVGDLQSVKNTPRELKTHTLNVYIGFTPRSFYRNWILFKRYFYSNLTSRLYPSSANQAKTDNTSRNQSWEAMISEFDHVELFLFFSCFLSPLVSWVSL